MKAKIDFDENNYIQRLFAHYEGEYELDDDFNFDYLFCYQLKDGKIVLDKKKAKAQDKREADLLKAQELHKQLESTDFMVIKSYEYFLAGLEIPYDFNKLHKERQDLRDKINELEK